MNRRTFLRSGIAAGALTLTPGIAHAAGRHAIDRDFEEVWGILAREGLDPNTTENIPEGMAALRRLRKAALA